MTDVEVVRFEPHGLVACEELLLADWLLKNHCDFINNDSLDTALPEQLSTDLSNISNQTSSMSLTKELALVRSCLVDVIYSLHCLGLWCTKRTIKLHLTEFARILNRNDLTPCDLVGSTLSVLHCMYSRLEDLSHQLDASDDDGNNTVLRGTTSQLRLLLKYVKSAEPPPNTSWPICIVHVSRRVIAKVIALWLYEISNEHPEYSFIKPNYIVGSSRKYRDRMAVDNFDLHREASIKDFRQGKCNTLIISTVNDRCADILKCNMVISFDPPARFEEFIHAKMNCRFESSKYVIILNELLGDDLERRVMKYINMEKIYSSSNRRDILDQKETELLKELEQDYPPYPSDRDSKNPATIHRSIGIINKYCTKLPSDSFTKLTPAWNVKEIDCSNSESYYCEVRLPINSPVRQAIIGPEAPTPAIAMRLAAFTACKVLHKAGELDENMSPIKKESMKALTPWLNTKEFSRPKSRNLSKMQSIGSTKHRQYYKKRIAKVFSGPLVSEKVPCYLYKCTMVLTCEIPDEQNRRGRRIIDPNETNRNYAIVCTTRLPTICAFPVFTRSGEVMISVELIQENFDLTSKEVIDLRTFHEYTFSKVLRLEKYPTVFDPKNSPFTVLLAPVIDDSASNTTQVDWDFVTKIVGSNDESFEPDIEQRKNFTFKRENYEDAVVIPWYRLTDRQQFAYYVAEICEDMSPQSPFPDTDSGFETFIDYYESKYNIKIYNKDQPVLDVDHTSARLNLLTPRYVNRKGRTLPSSTAKTRKESRESLVQKQLLIPELCTIHPFPAAFWRKAVCLPAIFYRLNSLFLAEELRREVAQEIKVGFVEPPEGFVWPELHFGWSLKDVIANQNNDDDVDDDPDPDLTTKPSHEPRGSPKKSDSEGSERQIPSPPERDNSAFVEPTTNPTQSDINCGDIVVDSKKLSAIESPVEVTVMTSETNTDLLDIVSKAYGSEFKEYSSIDRRRVLLGWYSLMNELDARVARALAQQPGLLQDDDIELVAVDDSLCDNNTDVQPSFGELLPNRDADCKWLDEAWKNIKFDPTRDEIESAGPGPSVILQALTMSNASDGINLERLETVGDSFLKYSITAFLYCTHLSMHEGKLSYLRSTEISNANLYRLGKLKNLGEIMSATKFEPNDNWLAPGYLVADGHQVNGSKDKKEIDKALAEVPYDLLRQHSIPDKSIADCVEALIGAYLTASGSRAALLFMRWLGLRVVPPEFDIEQDRQRTPDEDSRNIWRWLQVPPSPLINIPPYVDDKAPKTIDVPDQDELRSIATQKLNSLYRDNRMDRFEQEIEYVFRDKAYLVQAFTHNSFYENHVTDCHQRLEFLGDALLDYLITRYLFEDPRCHSPGTLTDLRSALVNNTFFASLAVKYNFHKYLKFISDELTNVIEGFVRKFKFESKDTITKGYTLLINEGESEYAEDIEVPKALGDVFESVAGAIYLDSGMSLDQVWQVYFKMMKPEIEYFSSHVPKSPIRELLESMPQNVRFSPSELTPDRKHRVTAEVFGLGKFTGLGRNKHSAKSTAAKRALRQLAKRKQTTSQNLAEQPAVKLDQDLTNQEMKSDDNPHRAE